MNNFVFWRSILQLLIAVRFASAFSQPDSNKSNVNNPSGVVFPRSANDVIRQAASAVSSSFLDGGINRQTIKIPLSDSMYGDKEEGFVADRAIGWQGGPQETLRFLLPLAKQLLKSVRTTEQASSSEVAGGLPPRISEQVLLDFDGSAMLTAESPAGPLGDIQALLQPNTDNYYSKLIATVENQFSDTPEKPKRLFLLLNPAWRDSSSWGYNIFGGGAAKKAQENILDRYEVTYAIDQFVVRGYKLSLLKVWPHDWCVFWEPMPYDKNNPNAEDNAKLLGIFKERPEYSQMDELLLDALKNLKK